MKGVLLAMLLALAPGIAAAAGFSAHVGEPIPGWAVSCEDDQFTAKRTCQAATTGFSVFYVGGLGPFVQPAGHDFPGRWATVRVDNGAVHTVDRGLGSRRLMQDMAAGKVAYVTYHVWPDGERRMTVDLTHFAEAMKRLDSIR